MMAFKIKGSFRFIQAWTEEIRVVPFHYIFLEFLWNDYFMFLRYMFDSIRASALRGKPTNPEILSMRKGTGNSEATNLRSGQGKPQSTYGNISMGK